MKLTWELNVLRDCRLGLLFVQNLANLLFGLQMKMELMSEIHPLLFCKENGVEKEITEYLISQFHLQKK